MQVGHDPDMKAIGFLTGLSVFFSSAPVMVPVMLITFSSLVIIDSFSGTMAAKWCSTVKSHIAREKLYAKIVQYGSIMAVFFLLSMVMSFFLPDFQSLAWYPFLCAIGNCCAIEVKSIGENVDALQSQGVKIVGLSALMIRAQRMFEAITNSWMAPLEDRVNAISPPGPVEAEGEKKDVTEPGK